MRRREMVTTAAAGLLGAVSGGQPAAARAAHDAPGYPPVRLDQLRLVNLAHVNDPASTPVFPGDPPFRLTTVATVPRDGYYLRYVYLRTSIEEGEHTGTHWGAQCHFEDGGRCADELDPHDLFRPAVRVDVRRQARTDADYAVAVADLRAFERRLVGGPINRRGSGSTATVYGLVGP